MYQNTIVIGHLGGDPSMRYTPSGASVTNFSVATTRKWTNAQGEPQEKTTWFKVVAWNKLAEVCNQYLAKGRLVMVEGDVNVSAYTDKQGQPAASLELTARNVKFLGGKGDSEQGETEPESEIPF